MKPKTIPKPIFTLIYVLLLVALAAACCYFIIARVVMENPHPALFGYSVARIITGSMEPTISVNDIVITKSQKEYNKDDIVSYVLDRHSITHRIVDITPEGRYITQGDANNSIDSPKGTALKNIKGKVILVIKPFWQYIAIGIIALLTCLSFISGKKKIKDNNPLSTDPILSDERQSE